MTVQEARSLGIVAGNETYIGRRVIATNIARELPVFIKYLTGSYRHITATAVGQDVPTPIIAALEEQFTRCFRVGNWLDRHIQAIYSDALHGRGVFMVIAKPSAPLNTTVVYVAPEDFVFPLSCRDIQTAVQVGVRYTISNTQFKEWQAKYAWDPELCKTILSKDSTDDKVQTMYDVWLMLTKIGGAVNAFWYSRDQNKLLSKAAPYNAGFLDAQGQPMPAPDYPIFPVYYNITENPLLIERKGRAHADMHDQEALTMGTTATINAYIRASEVYIALDQEEDVTNPEIVQTQFVMEPGKILKKKVKFFNTPSPDSSILAALQYLQTQNSNSAGQIDFAAANRKDSRKTAKELDIAVEQTDAANSVSLTMFAIGYKPLLQFMWLVLQHNIKSGYNQTFLADQPEYRAVLAEAKLNIAPAGDIDFIERQDKLKLYTTYYSLFAGTAVAPFFLQKILELAFPKEYPQMAPMLQDNSKQMGAALLQLLEALPPEVIPPEQAADFQNIIKQAQQTFGQPQTPNATAQNADTAGPVA